MFSRAHSASYTQFHCSDTATTLSAFKGKGWKIKFRFKRDKEGSIPGPVMLLCLPTWGEESAHLCLVYLGHELSLVVSKAPFVKKKNLFPVG